MKISFGPAFAAAALFAIGACAHSKDTTAASGESKPALGVAGAPSNGPATTGDNTTGATKPGSGGDVNTPSSPSPQAGTVAGDTPPGSSATQPSDTPPVNLPPSTGTPPSDTGMVGSSSDTSKPPDMTKSPDAKLPDTMAGTEPSPSSDATGSEANLRSATGSVANIDAQGQSITLDQAAGSSLTLTVDSSTKVLRNGRPLLGLQSLREGQKVRASFDPASNRASKIEIVSGKHRKHKKTMSPDDNGQAPKEQGTRDSDHPQKDQ